MFQKVFNILKKIWIALTTSPTEEEIKAMNAYEDSAWSDNIDERPGYL